MRLFKIILSITCLFLIEGNFATSQNVPDEYKKLVKQAESLYNAKDYKNSAFTYSSAFKINGWTDTPIDYYNAACSYALANNPDSTFFCLEHASKTLSYADYDNITKDKDLISLRGDKRWSPLLDIVRANRNNGLTLDKLKYWSERFTPILTLLGLLTFAFMIIMGLIHKTSEEFWLKRIITSQETNGKQYAKLFPYIKSEVFFWKDPSILKASFSACFFVGILVLSLVLNLVILNPEPKERLPVIIQFLSYANAALSLWIIELCIILYIKKRDLIKKNKLLLPSVVLIILTVIFALIALFFNVKLIPQFLILIFQSSFLSCAFGVSAACKHSKTLSPFLRVEIITTSGKIIDDLRFSSSNNSDYRFITSDNMECIFPREQIYQIKIVEQKPLQ